MHIRNNCKIPGGKLFHRLFLVYEHEQPALVWAFIYFFCLLSAYYILRPFRDEMGITGGVENLQWLFSGTFIVMLLIVPVFGYITKKYSRAQFLPPVYAFFSINIFLFFIFFKLGFSASILARIFFIWISVFNLFIVSVFWSFMTDIFSNEQAKRLFGIIAAGGSAGAITGPLLTSVLARELGPVNLLPIAAILLFFATFFIRKLIRWASPKDGTKPPEVQRETFSSPIGGSIWAGIQSVFRSKYLIGISIYILLYTAISTFLYFEQAHIVREALAEAAARTSLFANIDLITNILAISSQFLLTNRLMKRLGLAILLALVPFLVMFGFFTLSLLTLLPVLIAVQVIHRAGNFSLLRPGKEVLFTVADAEDRYKSKNFIDTALYRGGDALTGWLFAGLLSLGLGLSSIAFLAVPIAASWAFTGFSLGKRYNRLKEEK